MFHTSPRLALQWMLLAAIACRPPEKGADDSGAALDTACTPGTRYNDADGDGFGDPSAEVQACPNEAGTSDDGTDCDDDRSDVHPGADEVCEPVDHDCDGTDGQDEESSGWYADRDRDGHGDPEAFFEECSAEAIAAGARTNTGDCDDADSATHEDAEESVGDEVDQDCDGAERCFMDSDGDGARGDASVESADLDCDDPGEAPSTALEDCDDSRDDVHPGADEADCGDPTDYNCDGSVGYADEDADGYAACEDCWDLDASIHPGADERIGDSIDGDCDGGEVCYADADADGYADDSGGTTASADYDCYDDAEVTDEGARTDCDDRRADVNPAGVEVCDELDADEDCDGLVDDADDSVDPAGFSAWYPDADGDGYGTPDAETVSCDGPGSGYSSVSGDAIDEDSAVHPGTQEGRVFWKPSGGSWEDWTDDHTLDEPLAPAQITLTESGTLLFTEGTFYVHISDETNIGNITTILGLGAEETTLDGAELDRVLYWSGAGIVGVSDLTITHGATTGGGGGGIYTYGAALTLRDCVITDNTASGYGGGVAHTYSGPYSGTLLEIDACEISSNSGATGGVWTAVGAASSSLHVLIQGSVFSDNDGMARAAGGLDLYNDGMSLVLEDTVFSGNAGYVVGAIGGFTGTWTLTNVDLYDNTGLLYGGAMYLGGDVTTTCDGAGEVATDGTLTGNSAPTGGGVYLKTGATFTTTGCDWGAGSTDNSPADVFIQATGGTYSTDDARASFTCDDAGCR